MKSFALAAFFGSLAQAHYQFDTLVINGNVTGALEYVRNNARKEKYMPTKFINSFDNLTPLDTDFRCNLGATNNGASTGTAEIKAGDELGMKLWGGGTMQHPGPAVVYMSKAPSLAQDYDGSGGWFKIHAEGTCRTTDITTTSWCTWDKDRITFTVPADTPDGEYLVRAEHLALQGAHVNETEFYYACAQVKITGGGAGVPGPLVNIPGVYQLGDPAVFFNIWSPATGYDQTLGPELWTGGSFGGGIASAISSVSSVAASAISSVVQNVRPIASSTTLATSFSTAVAPAAASSTSKVVVAAPSSSIVPGKGKGKAKTSACPPRKLRKY